MPKNKVEVVRMTPDMARAILKNNPNNRNVKRDRVSLYASDMEKGRWQLNGESIVIDADGNLKDGQEIVDISPLELVKKAEALGCGEIIINSVDNDGMMKGYDLNLVKQISEAVSVPVIACGGAGGINDLEKVIHQAGAHAAAGGSMFVYYGRLKAVLITAPSEKELTDAGIYKE